MRGLVGSLLTETFTEIKIQLYFCVTGMKDRDKLRWEINRHLPLDGALVVNGERVGAPEKNSRPNSGNANRIIASIQIRIATGIDGEINGARGGWEEAAWEQGLMLLCV